MTILGPISETERGLRPKQMVIYNFESSYQIYEKLAGI